MVRGGGDCYILYTNVGRNYNSTIKVMIYVSTIHSAKLILHLQPTHSPISFSLDSLKFLSFFKYRLFLPYEIKQGIQLGFTIFNSVSILLKC